MTKIHLLILAAFMSILNGCAINNALVIDNTGAFRDEKIIKEIIELSDIKETDKILDLACLRQLGFPLPNPLIEVSQIYHDKLERHLPNAYFDLSLEAICKHLELPIQDKHDALQDAISAALVFVRLTKGDLPSLSVPYT